jgi:hypothetical protein
MSCPQAGKVDRRYLCQTKVLHSRKWACALRAPRPSIESPRRAIRYVIAHCGLCFEEPPPASGSELLDRRLVCLGDDTDGQAIEVIAVESDKNDLIVIHAMALRDKYRAQYEEAKQWRR